MKLQENNIEELAMNLNPGGDEPKTGGSGTDGSGGGSGTDDPDKK